jgi:hypothetical protein
MYASSPPCRRRSACPGSWPKPTGKEGEHDSKVPESIAHERRATPTRTRVEGAAITLLSSSSKSANLEVHTSTTARSARTLQGNKITIPMRIWPTASAYLRVDTLRRKCSQLEEHIRRDNGQAIACEPAVQSSPRGPGSRTLRVHHLRKAARLIGSGLHIMQILASFESQKFGSEGLRRLRPRSRSGPCPSARACTSVSAKPSSTTACLHDPLRAPLYALIRFSERQPPG